ncbi:MAG: hypothetical protein CYPHOPRED_003187 [Cyphobasidiales sp. Tagirdzhanova-0007]|nr:MAG: hypothetical protein CYPHOPRED_003187 [Cyphobasidiales sp. Tagirdzhanova-0007]
MIYSTVQTRGAQIAYIDQGAGENTYIFLRYWGGLSRTWDSVIIKLKGEARCIVLDQRGWGSSRSLDNRYDLDAMADDVEDVVSHLGLRRYILVGHSMGGKVAQIVAARLHPNSSTSPHGLVLVAPAPPSAMPIPREQRAAMLTSYQSQDGIEQALTVLAGRHLTDAEREGVITDTLGGAQGAKTEWTERGMIAVIDERLREYQGPVTVVVGELDKVEKPEALRAIYGSGLPQAKFEIVPGVGHLVPIEV